MNWTKESSIFSRKTAEKEFAAYLNQRYRITTIKWKYSEYDRTLEIDSQNVQKNTYEMKLAEFVTDWMDHFIGHPDEDIIRIERIR